MNKDQKLLEEALSLGRPAILTVPQYDASSGNLVDRGCLLDPFFNPVPNLDPNRTNVAMVIGACLWIPKQLWDELEGFPDWFGSIAEDMYLCCRARLAGYAVRALSESGYTHWQGKSFGGNKPDGGRLSSTFKRRHLSERNKLQVMLLTINGIRLTWLLPMHLALCLAEALAICTVSANCEYASKVQIPALREVWQIRTRLTSLRGTIQQSRLATAAEFNRVFTRFPRKLVLFWRYGIPRLQ
jgi:GT2 family glycosyltransferase